MCNFLTALPIILIPIILVSCGFVLYSELYHEGAVVEVSGILGGVEGSSDKLVLLIDGHRYSLSGCNCRDEALFRDSVGQPVSFTYREVGSSSVFQSNGRLLSVGGIN